MSLEKVNNDSMIIKYQNTNNVLEDICSIIESARDYAYKSVNIALVERNWLIGYRIAEEELKGNDRADYGLEIIKKLSKELTKQYGKGYDSRNLYYFLNFYKLFPNILNALSSKSNIQNQIRCYLGLIIELCYKFLIKKQEIGMKKKH